MNKKLVSIDIRVCRKNRSSGKDKYDYFQEDGNNNMPHKSYV